MKPLSFIILVVLMSSCSANWHLRQAIKKDPSILQARDTTIVVDTTIITEEVIRKDTITLSEYDTITVHTDSVSYQIIRERETFYVEVECPPDTIPVYVEKTIELPPQIIYRNGIREWINGLPWVARAGIITGITLLIGLIVLSIIRKALKIWLP